MPEGKDKIRNPLVLKEYIDFIQQRKQEISIEDFSTTKARKLPVTISFRDRISGNIPWWY